MTCQDPIHLARFRHQAAASATTAVDRQFRQSFGLVAILLAATAVAALAGLF